jgi:transcriptional regulator with XRE-family HTH domain
VHTNSQFIGPQLRAARELAGLRQIEIARALRLDPATVSRWEFDTSTRYAPVPAKYLGQLASYLGVSVEELTGNGHDEDDAPHAEPDVSQTDRHRQITYSSSPVTDVQQTRMAGRPERDEVANELIWRLRCWHCHFVNERRSSFAVALPNVCDACGTQIRARVSLSITR